MTRHKFLKGVFLVLMGFMFSCDNTTDDPINNAKNNPNNPNNSGGSTVITGPRILNKITANGFTDQEFVTTGTTLEKAIFRDAGTANSFLIGKVTYTSGRITKVKYQQEINGAVTANSLSYEFDLTYDANGKINYTTCSTMIGTMPNFNMEYTYSYDSAGKITQIVEKKKSGTTYTHFTNYNFTNTGDNITKVEAVMGMTSSTGVPDMSTLITTNYNYTSFDTKINPYNTLPKAFFVTWSLLHPFNFVSLSANNVINFDIVSQGPTTIPGSYTYLYDSQNYPVSDQTQSQKYIYKAL